MAPSGADSGRAAPSAEAGDEPAGHAGRIAPEYAQGRLWVRPLPLPPRELAQRLSGNPRALADSVVNRAIQQFLDSVEADPGSRGAAMPSWTTQIAGKKFGIDQKYLYVAGLRIPAAVLALLPLPAGGTNYDRDKAWRQAMDLRTDLMQAAQRAENAAEFKRQIKAIRERKQQEEEFRRNQATPPDPAATPPAAPPASPPTP
ncbi:MAG TPA: hypothetical protein VFS40_09820 [Gemmatimonadales bacterium]|nr:hypothetical protein [Gemmatimonadales bacterium]